MDGLAGCVAGWPFAAGTLAALLTGGAGTVALLAWPAGSGPMAAFAEEFRRWCFGREAAGLDVALLVLALSSPIVLSGIVLAFWGRPLRSALRATPLRVASVAASCALAVALTGVALFTTQREVSADASGRLAFPGADIRTAVPAPEVVLPDHRGRTTSLEDLRGRVVVVTAIYVSCNTACPMILAESRDLMEALPADALKSVTLVGLTLDPERDTPQRLAEVAAGYALGGDVRLLAGEPAAVNRALDRFGFERRRDPGTGRIDHSGFFVVIDKQGRIAYRLAASSSQPHWLPQAVAELAAEPATAVPPPLG